MIEVKAESSGKARGPPNDVKRSLERAIPVF